MVLGQRVVESGSWGLKRGSWMRPACIFSLLLCLAAVGARAQQSDTGQPVLTVRSTLVQVPALVKTKGRQVVFRLTADDFLLTDDRSEEHTSELQSPMSLV